ncbi:MAG: prephenate dehydratase [Clostridia bacterium]|nr:prephenate dehydratase [Clostridia bacterium]
MSLKPIRDEIDKIDEQLITLFCRRMNCSKKVAEYKMEHGMEIYNAQREEQILDTVERQAGVYGGGARQLYAAIMQISRALQHDMLGSGQQLCNEILSADQCIPFDSDSVKIACFGVPGTYAHRATKKVFPHSTPDFYPSFQDVFSAIQNGNAEFGIIPIENSSAGSVTDVYDLMLKYRFYIATAADIAINHVLAAADDIALTDITKVYSHQQALSQCSDFLRSHPEMDAQSYISTAAAAKMLSESGDKTSAVICSEEAAKEYGLSVLLRGFQNNPNNTTRFIVISKKMFIEEKADKISLCFSIPHRTGSLYNILCRFAVHGLNLTKLESRPIFGTSFEYLFYLDFTGNIKSKETLGLLAALSDELTEFSFLGNYRER